MADQSDVVRTTTRLVFPVVLIFALEQVFHASRAPGEGFSGGLLVALSILLLYVGMGYREVEASLPRISRWGVPIGLGLAVCTGLPGLISGEGFLAGASMEIEIMGRSEPFGTPALFDLGIFLLVASGALAIFRAIGQSEVEEA